MKKQHQYDKVAYILQGGGALGAYQIGVVEELHNSGYYPTIISGISIGAINAAIIAGNPPEKRVGKLHDFWNKISPHLFFHDFDNYEYYYNIYNRVGAMWAALLGQPGFFRPRLNPPPFLATSIEKLSFYTTDELRQSLNDFIDFDRINSKEMQLYLGAVNVATGKLTFFNNIDHKITTEHVMASAAFPPAFSAVKIENDYYWDGGIYSNTPVAAILDAQMNSSTLCFSINCFNCNGELPQNMDEVYRRIKQINFSSHLTDYLENYSKTRNLRSAISYLSQYLPTEIKNKPEIKAIVSEGRTDMLHIVNIVYSYTDKDSEFIDYNFYRNAIDAHIKRGKSDALGVLENKSWAKECDDYVCTVVYSAPRNPCEKEGA